MFKVIRPLEEPPELKTKGYNCDEVVHALWKICHRKCYLCETMNPDAPEIEHKEPHENKDEDLKVDWNNLFYSCRRCNSIKGTKHKNILDVAQVDPITKIIWNMAPSNYSDVTFEKVDKNCNDKAVDNTIKLLERCFNETGTAFRGITREALIEKIEIKLQHFLKQAYKIRHEDSDEDDIEKARKQLKVMLQNEYPYSAFWRWRFLRDPVLMRDHSDLLPEYVTLSPCKL